MKKRFLDFLERQGIQNMNSRHLNIACILWMLPLGTIWMGIYIIWMVYIKKYLKAPQSKL